jgi:hypothetical protein
MPALPFMSKQFTRGIIITMSYPSSDDDIVLVDFKDVTQSYPGYQAILDFIKWKRLDSNSELSPFEYIVRVWKQHPLPAKVRPSKGDLEKYAKLYWDEAILDRDNLDIQKEWVEYASGLRDKRNPLKDYKLKADVSTVDGVFEDFYNNAKYNVENLYEKAEAKAKKVNTAWEKIYNDHKERRAKAKTHEEVSGILEDLYMNTVGFFNLQHFFGNNEEAHKEVSGVFEDTYRTARAHVHKLFKGDSLSEIDRLNNELDDKLQSMTLRPRGRSPSSNTSSMRGDDEEDDGVIDDIGDYLKRGAADDESDDSPVIVEGEGRSKSTGRYIREKRRDNGEWKHTDGILDDLGDLAVKAGVPRTTVFKAKMFGQFNPLVKASTSVIDAALSKVKSSPLLSGVMDQVKNAAAAKVASVTAAATAPAAPAATGYEPEFDDAFSVLKDINEWPADVKRYTWFVYKIPTNERAQQQIVKKFKHASNEDRAHAIKVLLRGGPETMAYFSGKRKAALRVGHFFANQLRATEAE